MAFRSLSSLRSTLREFNPVYVVARNCTSSYADLSCPDCFDHRMSVPPSLALRCSVRKEGPDAGDDMASLKPTLQARATLRMEGCTSSVRGQNSSRKFYFYRTFSKGNWTKESRRPFTGQ